jgi:hypothetical protein
MAGGSMMMYVDCFTAGLDDLKRKEQRDMRTVLKKLSTMKRFSVFEASDNDVIAKTMTDICQGGYIETTGGDFPWTEFKITPKGQAVIDEVKNA